MRAANKARSQANTFAARKRLVTTARAREAAQKERNRDKQRRLKALSKTRATVYLAEQLDPNSNPDSDL